MFFKLWISHIVIFFFGQDIENFASSILSVIRECENDVLYDLNHLIANTSPY